MRTDHILAAEHGGGHHAVGLEQARQQGEWNRIRVRCVGRIPVITTWINDVQMCRLDTATITGVPNYDPETVAQRLGREGHIALEIHDVVMSNPLGRDRWEVGAKCRWKNISVREL